MNRGNDDLSPQYISSYLLNGNGPYSSLASSASSSTSSVVWSDASSQSSDDSSVTSTGASDPEIRDTYSCTSQPSSYQTAQAAQAAYLRNVSKVSSWPQHAPSSVVIPSEQRQHPRRTNSSLHRPSCPPALVRQSDRKVNFVDSLVDSSAQIVEAIWPLSSVPCRTDVGSKGVLPLRTFIQETLRRSRTSYSTLQVALYYLILIKPHVPGRESVSEQGEDSHSFRALQCGRRMFLAALILASKYLQDRNYSARAWSKISGLATHEINQNEVAFLLAVKWKLHITDVVFQRWTNIVLEYTPSSPPSSGSLLAPNSTSQTAEWKSIILGLNVELDNIDVLTVSTRAGLGSAVRSCPPVIDSTSKFDRVPAEMSSELSFYAPPILEPPPSDSYCQSKPAPAYGLLPTPRLTPQSVGFRTPAASSIPCSKPSMAFAMSQACSGQLSEKWVTSSPTRFFTRRSSLARSTSQSSLSSPESMVSDSSSRSSRSSSISSASSSMCAPQAFKLDVQARCRSAQQYEATLPTAVPSEHEFSNTTLTSPESYYNAVVATSVKCPIAEQFKDVDAARTLQELQTGSFTVGCKRSRPLSMERCSSMQETVRSLLGSTAGGWSNDLVRPHMPQNYNADSIPRSVDSRKRFRWSKESNTVFPTPTSNPEVGLWATQF